jgi:hypothetical protein
LGNENLKCFQAELQGLPLNQETKKYHQDQQKCFLEAIKTNIEDASWDKRGCSFLFFNFRKVPAGIKQMRTILNSSLSDEEKLTKLHALAQRRVKSPPFWTKRDNTVEGLYRTIAQMSITTITDEAIQAVSNGKTAPKPT